MPLRETVTGNNLSIISSRWLSKKAYPPLAAPEATRVHIQGVVFAGYRNSYN